jgi:SAM-dependent methyltransferase
MAIIKSMAALLMDEAKRRPFSGTVLQLGKQDVWLDEAELEEVAQYVGFHLRPVAHKQLVNSQFRPGKTVVSDRHFFESLGFSEVISLDASGFEGATIVHDLNLPSPPEHLRQRFDVIVNFGTLEHVFHLPNALRNIHEMLKSNGRVIHSTPASNALEHGFYMFSPCFLLDYYRQNGYDIGDFKLVRYRIATIHKFVEVLDYPVDRGWGDSTGRLDDAVYSLYAVMVKSATAKTDFVPQQNHYIRLWRDTVATPQSADPLLTEPAEQPSGPAGCLRVIYRRLKSLPLVGMAVDAVGTKVMQANRAIRNARAIRREWKRIPGD